MNEKKIFDKFEQAIEYIIDKLDKNERESIRNGDVDGLHLALDRWIKKDYVYSGTTNIIDLIYKNIRNEDTHFRNNPDEKLNIHPDDLSGIIINALIKKIK